MPFTPAHVVAVLPFQRIRALPLVALIVGSMAPDAPYFIPESWSARLPNTHALPGSVTIAPLFGLSILLILIALRRPLSAPLWGIHRQLVSRWLAEFGSRYSDWLWAVPAIYLGVATHVVWDSFTHYNGWSVLQWPLFQSILFKVGHRPIALFRLLQWLSSIAGLLVLGLVYQRAVSRSELIRSSVSDRNATVLALLAIFCISLVVGILRSVFVEPRHDSINGRLFVGITSAMVAFAVGYLGLGLARARTWRD